MHITTRKLAAAAVTGAAYAALTMLLAPISYGAIQCLSLIHISEPTRH